MGSILLGIVARRRSEKKPLNNSLEIGECVLESKEVLLLETPPLGTRHKKSLNPEPVKQSVKIGKLARIPDRRIGDEQQVIVKVSHDEHFSYQRKEPEKGETLEPSDWANCAFKSPRITNAPL